MNLPTYKTTFDIYLPATAERGPRFLEQVEVDAYENFGEEFLTTESSEKIEKIKARHLGLLTGKDIRALRKRLGVTQDSLSELLECGKKSLSRWENGRGYPSGVVNKLLRLLEDGRTTLADLKAASGPRNHVAIETFVQKRKSKIIRYNFGRQRLSIDSSKCAEPAAI